MIRPLVIGALLLFGCGHESEIAHRSVDLGSALVSGGYRLANAKDKAKQDGFVARARGDAGHKPDPYGAEAEQNAWKPKRDRAFTTLDALSVGVETVFAMIPAFTQALDKQTRAELLRWVPILAKLSGDVIQSLAEIDVHVPGFGGSP